VFSAMAAVDSTDRTLRMPTIAQDTRVSDST
jgi:hypothetical protein